MGRTSGHVRACVCVHVYVEVGREDTWNRAR